MRIGNDQHLIIDGKRLDASTPHFENVYNFGRVWKENHYFGHVNEVVAERYGRWGLARLFHDETCEHVVGLRHYLAMGDNTMNSFDGRAWGDFPEDKVVGKAGFVFWPIGDRLAPDGSRVPSRFGWGYR